MTDGKHELELDLEPRHTRTGQIWELLVPVHADNFALALAAGYVGGSLKTDPAEDLQLRAGDGLVGFSAEVPSWAISEGEPGDRVILSIERHSDKIPAAGSIETISRPLRVTKLRRAYFKDETSLAAFKASYDAFPDVPIDVVELATRWPVYAESEPNGVEIEPLNLHKQRQSLDFICGFSAGVLSVLGEGSLDEAILDFLQKPATDLGERARNLLISLEPRSTQADIAIWCATIESLRSRFGKRGFDRREFLQTLESILVGHGSEVDSWINGCRKVIDGQIDPPTLADGDKIGRRAALAIILSHESSELGHLQSSLSAGPKVCSLVKIAVHAFTGLARADEALKSPASRMDAILEMGERLAEGHPVQVEFETLRTGSDLARHQIVKVEGRNAFNREIEPPAYMVMLKARIQEAGYKVELDASGKIGIRPAAAKRDLILVEDCPQSTPGNPVVNLVLPITTLGVRPTVTSLKKLMSAAWDHATTVAVRARDGNDEVVTMASLPLATLDRDELNFHVERLLQVAISLSGRPGKGRRTSKS